ncbi:T9SS sorting signal type C domain-containing protein [Flavobacterium psychrophilum]|uniref:T9SS sorting signal type C domain-containing protein n=1 Tax=Flavobacterium psychrophilum TaxID=96345 RepID=UPI001C8F4EA9|nr:T9SS sorting signal type C domain-containing protein [Flavobacterium psychrophilum]QZL00266.1 T9SS sorting signal type C domain-containing protein [Flavobacterium psychrophilum]
MKFKLLFFALLSVSFASLGKGTKILENIRKTTHESCLSSTCISYPPCTIPVIASVFPLSGPAGTSVTINASSGSLLNSTVNFNGTAATIISSSALQLVVIVPLGATTGAINIVHTTCIASTATFTIVNKDKTSCQGAYPTTTDLIIYEIHDEKSGAGGTVTLYNGTNATIDLSNYKFYRSGNYGDGSDGNYAALSGSISPGTLGVLHVGASDSANACRYPASTNGYLLNGFNANDGLSLRDSSGSIVIDDVHVPTNVGFYMVRNLGAYSPRAVFVDTDWSTTMLASGVCDSRLGILPATVAINPAITAQPLLSLICSSTNASISVTATEGFLGGNALAYQWYVVAPSTTAWTALINGGVYSGATSTTLNISSLTGLDGYQYYCQVRENSGTCYTATVATKIEIGTTTWNGSTWSNGAPILSKATIINGNYTTAVSGSFSTCNLTVNPTFTFTISANTYVEIQENLTNNGIFKISNTGSLIQINDAGVNTGNISYERIASAKLQDYVYWSSPISGFNVNSISPSTPAYYHWIWNPTVANTNGGLGNWQNASATMTAGQGYIVRAPNGFSNASVQNWTATFNNGVPFNGVYKPIISRGSYTSGNYIGTNGEQISADDDNWNLLGNPYPSAISINSFLLANTQLDGFVRLWTHNTLPASTASPFYASFSSNYTGADYISINAAGATSGPGTLNVIGGGQGFFTLMLPGVATTSTALFNNAMRKKTLSNSQFYKTTDNHLTANEEIGEDIERNRIWIDLKNPTGETTRTLVAYVEGATLERDRMFDATTDYKSDQNLYSLIGNDIMTIQGRGLPFDVNDTVPMGIKVPTNGTYNIALAAVDGLFSKNAQKIYIEDKLLNTINDITAFPYQFTTNQGIINDRFVLRYTNQMLTNTDFKLNENTIAVFGSDNEIKINTSLEKIKNYTVCNVLGQTLAEKNNINTNQSVINTVLKSNQALIVKVTLANGQTIIKKIVF